MKIKGKPDVSAFLDGGKADQEKAPTPAPVVARPDTIRANSAEEAAEKLAAEQQAAKGRKRQKLVELPEPLFHALKDRAYEDYKRTGKRVTETEIIIAALSKYLDIQV